MPKFRVTGPDGVTYKVTGPEGSTEQDALAQVQQQVQPRNQPQQPTITPEKLGEYGFTQHMVEQGAMLGFGDEATAGFNAALDAAGNVVRGKPADFSKNYGGYVDARRRQKEEYEGQHPIASTGATVLGGMGVVAPAKGAQFLSQAPGLFETAKAGAKIGGAYGATAGFGSGEDGLANRATNAGVGGALGSATGFVAPYLLRGAGAVYQGAKNVLGFGDSTARAERMVSRAIERDSDSLESLRERLLTTSGNGKPVTIADVGGQNVQRTLRGAATVPGKASERVSSFVNERNLAQPDRMASDVRQTLTPVSNYQGVFDELATARTQQSRTLYDEAFTSNAPVWNNRLQQFLDDPVLQNGLNRGLKIQRLEALANNEPFEPRAYGVVDFNAAGDPVIGGTPNLRLLDAAKRGLDDILEGYRDKTTGRLVLDETGKAIEGVRKAYVNELDSATSSLVPAYSQARAAWAGPSRARDAMALGRRALGADSDLTAKAIGALPEADKEFFRIGVADAIMDKIKATPDGSNAARRIFGNDLIRERLSAAFGDDKAFDDFARRMMAELNMYKAGQFVSPNTGSQTQMRGLDANEINPNMMVDVGLNLAQGNYGRALGDIGRVGLGRIQGIRSGDTAAQIADMLLAGPKQAGPMLDRLSQRPIADRAEQARHAAMVRALLAPSQGRAAGSGQ